MDLKTWMKNNRWTASKMSKELGMNATVLREITIKYRRPGPQTINKLVEFTEGQVSYEDLHIPDYEVISCPCCGRKTLLGRLEKGWEDQRVKEKKVLA